MNRLSEVGFGLIWRGAVTGVWEVLLREGADKGAVYDVPARELDALEDTRAFPGVAVDIGAVVGGAVLTGAFTPVELTDAVGVEVATPAVPAGTGADAGFALC